VAGSSFLRAAALVAPETGKRPSIPLEVESVLNDPIRTTLVVEHDTSPARSTESTHREGELRLDVDQRTVWCREEELHLTPNEYRLLAVMVRRAGRVVRHGELLRRVWGPAAEVRVSSLRVYIRQLRVKLEEDPGRPRRLVTVPGVGYRLNLAWLPEGSCELREF
jgi:DNA-binding response OmpR family regulator